MDSKIPSNDEKMIVEECQDEENIDSSVSTETMETEEIEMKETILRDILDGEKLDSFVPIDYISVSLGGVNVPNEILKHIFSFMRINRETRLSLSLVSHDFCIFLLSYTRTISIPNIDGIFCCPVNPLISDSHLLPVILRNTEQIVFEDAKFLSWNFTKNEEGSSTRITIRDVLTNDKYSQESEKVLFTLMEYSKFSKVNSLFFYELKMSTVARILTILRNDQVFCNQITELSFPKSTLQKEGFFLQPSFFMHVFPNLRKIENLPSLISLGKLSHQIEELGLTFNSLMELNNLTNPLSPQYLEMKNIYEIDFKKVWKLTIFFSEQIGYQQIHKVMDDGLEFLQNLEELDLRIFAKTDKRNPRMDFGSFLLNRQSLKIFKRLEHDFIINFPVLKFPIKRLRIFPNPQLCPWENTANSRQIPIAFPLLDCLDYTLLTSIFIKRTIIHHSHAQRMIKTAVNLETFYMNEVELSIPYTGDNVTDFPMKRKNIYLNFLESSVYREKRILIRKFLFVDVSSYRFKPKKGRNDFYEFRIKLKLRKPENHYISLSIDFSPEMMEQNLGYEYPEFEDNMVFRDFGIEYLFRNLFYFFLVCKEGFMGDVKLTIGGIDDRDGKEVKLWVQNLEKIMEVYGFDRVKETYFETKQTKWMEKKGYLNLFYKKRGKIIVIVRKTKVPELLEDSDDSDIDVNTPIPIDEIDVDMF